MNEETTQEVINYLLGEVKRLTTELNIARNSFAECFDNYASLTEKYNALKGKMSNNTSKNKNSLDPSFSSVVNSV